MILQVRFRHADTDAYLMASEQKYHNPIPGQMEVCGMKRKDKKALWESAEGVYFALIQPSNAHDEL